MHLKDECDGPVIHEDVNEVGAELNNSELSLKRRFRALFTLKNMGSPDAISWIGKCFSDPSALLKHELAYCLGQIGHPSAIPVLSSVLRDVNQEPMVRHEAGEALGAIGTEEVLPVLEQYEHDICPEVAETCQIAIERIRWLQKPDCSNDELSSNPYLSVDPAPPFSKNAKDVHFLKSVLLNSSCSLWERYRAMFSLRNIGTAEAVLAIVEGLKCPESALFRHEIAFVLGQIQSPEAICGLKENLSDVSENCMVRHECAEALGAIAKDECVKYLEGFLKDPERVVYESCEVALDIVDYVRNDNL